ncbi:MAG: hypothetical protein HYV07_04070 [Deltaproteobacteria bacterium]|nr:hypothetical protein [Deltaproteobacteria bacterium]
MSKLVLRGRIEEDLIALLGEQLAGLSREDGPVEIDLSQAKIEGPEVARAVAEVLRDAGARLGAIQVKRPPKAIVSALEGDPSVELVCGE